MSAEAVMAYIQTHFDMGHVRVEPFPALPYGQRVIDGAGAHMVVYWDIQRQRVVYTLPNEEGH